MAELILTDAEKAAELWTDFDDAELGALMRKNLIRFKTAALQMDRAMATTCALLLCCDAADAGASELVLSLEGVTQGGHDFGEWTVTAKRKP
jgi:hypothetical protein